jgi:hypothetical protein
MGVQLLSNCVRFSFRKIFPKMAPAMLNNMESDLDTITEMFQKLLSL